MSRPDIGSNGRRGRRSAVRHERSKFLIVCEGSRTEPLYFEKFRVSKELRVEGIGMNTVSLVRRAIALRDQYKRLENREFDQVWCVFDRDSFPTQDFNSALSLIEQEDARVKAASDGERRFRVAYSNQAFEIWYLLHFHYHNASLHRDEYKDKISAEIGREYKKNDSTIFDTLRPLMATAIANAKRLHQIYVDQGNVYNPTDNNPDTLVYELVEELRRNLPGENQIEEV